MSEFDELLTTLERPANGSGPIVHRGRDGSARHPAVEHFMIWTAIKSYFACAWSAFTYIFQGMPADKESYWKRCLGFSDPIADLVASWKAYKADPSFHHLKDIPRGVDRRLPRRAKVMALGGCLFAPRHR